MGRRKTIQCVLRDITEQRQALTLQDAIYRIAVAAETTKSLNDLFPEIHEIILSVMPAENFYITLYDEKQNLLRFPYFKDALDEPYIDEIEPGKGLTAYVLKTGKSLLCTQAVHDDLERQGKVVLLGVPSAIWLGVPLIIEEKTIGAMVVQHYTDPQAYGEREQHMLEFVSSQVALAISRKQVEDKLRHMSTHDMLTGLFNRTFCDEEIARLQRGRQFPVSIVIADVDDLKKTNDLRGHAAGDDLLISVAKVLTTAFRREDMVARIGGDEFIVLMPKTAAAVADEALRRVRGLLVLYNAAHVETPLHLSLGVSTAQKGTPLAEVLKEADRSMYAEKQKHSGPNSQTAP
ncbi:MAG: diguanylate cyclase [Chloroflexi bacterium]|nr:diguanylate cyclase [Chloroflexota bacterium]